jgi:phenylacetate-coenzyme A ligase PaaK-like adenylate-forming protein
MADQYYDPKIETLPSELLRKVQNHRLRWQFRRCWDGSAWNRARFEAAGLSPETFEGLADLERLPVLSLAELRQVSAEAWRVAPPEWIVATGQEVGFPERSRTDGDAVHERDRDRRAAHAGATAGPPALTLLDVPFDARTLGFECAAREGLHWADDHVLAEIIDPLTAHPAVRGRLDQPANGELVVSDLVREASPLLRYRTGVTVALTYDPCACGRTSSRVLDIGPLR